MIHIKNILTGNIALLKVLDDSQSALIAGRVLACRDQRVTNIVGLTNWISEKKYDEDKVHHQKNGSKMGVESGEWNKKGSTV